MLVCLIFLVFVVGLRSEVETLDPLEAVGIDGNLPGKLLSFGDLHSRKSVDLIVLNGFRVSIFEKDKIYEMKFSADLKLFFSSEVSEVFSVNLIDIDFDGNLDMIAVGRDEALFQLVVLSLPFKSDGVGEPVLLWRSERDLRSPPLVFDFDFDRRLDFLVDLGPSGGSRSIIDFQGNISEAGDGKGKLLSSFFADMNGDCKADVAILSESNILEIWLAVEGRYVPQENEIQVEGNRILVGDFRRVGVMDILSFNVDSQVATFTVYPNLQPGLCSGPFQGGATSPCRPDSSLCSSLIYDSVKLGSRCSSNRECFPSSAEVIVSQFDRALAADGFPVVVGDLDLDGFPDLLIRFEGGVACIARNYEGSFTLETNSCFKTGPGSSAVFFEGVVPSKSWNFWDTPNYPEVLILAIEREGKPQVFHMHIQSSHERYQLKALATNGVASADALGVKYGALLVGGSFKITVTDELGEKSVRQCMLNDNLILKSLEVPLCYFGLGRTNNYVSEVFVGVPAAKKDPYWHLWVSIIPNTFLIANPFPPKSPSEWQIELAVSPSRFVWIILVAAAGSLLFLAALLLFLERKERSRENVRNREGFAAHFINS